MNRQERIPAQRKLWHMRKYDRFAHRGDPQKKSFYFIIEEFEMERSADAFAGSQLDVSQFGVARLAFRRIMLPYLMPPGMTLPYLMSPRLAFRPLTSHSLRHKGDEGGRTKARRGMLALRSFWQMPRFCDIPGDDILRRRLLAAGPVSPVGYCWPLAPASALCRRPRQWAPPLAKPIG